MCEVNESTVVLVTFELPPRLDGTRRSPVGSKARRTLFRRLPIHAYVKNNASCHWLE